MNRLDVTELHYIAPMANLRSILARGILSHRKAQRFRPQSVAEPSVQERRSTRRIPGGSRLHDYANLYWNARNAMLFAITHPPVQAEPEDLIILRISPSVLDRPGVVITDINAAVGTHPRWYPVEIGLARLDRDELFAERWTGSEDHKQRMMAEVLVPSRVPPEYVTGAYVVSEEVLDSLPPAERKLDLRVWPYMFFRGPKS